MFRSLTDSGQKPETSAMAAQQNQDRPTGQAKKWLIVLTPFLLLVMLILVLYLRSK
jgi:hypothetical protein